MNLSGIFFHYRYARLFLLGICVSCFVGFTWFWGWNPLFCELSRKYIQTADNQVKNDAQSYQYYKYVSGRQNRKDDFDSVHQWLLSMTSHPSSIEITKFLEEVADKSGVKKADIRWLERRQTHWYEEKIFELKVTGNFVALELFFEKLAEHEPLVIFSYSQWLKSDESGDINVMTKGHSYRWLGKEH
ncbi:type 4a pilus biogenesis protein PilO [Vibrio salinus]|uniref:type 4a pilus biogenesis protein PilO n=1 Tax=Vibrio salinus TaxID=2899784 RepID=UPI001E2BC549|nr:type 4a pilus biogenesis protein PilO [Vibrio salinus]MCE0493963.1 type 4a pilus biogenesis protein PilO [Vibrio salinus]